ncbi:putative sensor domain DACNV-containing protein [Dyadobacter subterraneus]|uniref:Probable sensor domain-containing protein n=1 Tax=Dyadobacter subterraneus TaxID=2773304 RepID=A0ABR9WAH9_9BACT|nr:hypothetical protein [Dyadobacter subterraneus]MBE9462487.1 hypothetical protein [Dyadobacter subterraneus]
MARNFNEPVNVNSTISTTTYQAAQSVAKTVEEHFIFHHENAKRHNKDDFAPKPDAQVIESIIDTTFWASLRREEGHSPSISLAFLPPELSGQPLIFEKRLTFTPAILTKLAPAVERSGIHLGIWMDGDELYIWGTTRVIPNLCFVLEVIEPGMLVIKHRRIDGFGKFVNVAVLKGDQIKIVDDISGKIPDCPNLVTSLIGFNSSSLWNDSLNVMVQLAVSMRDHKRGGILLVVPSGRETWRDSIIHPISYSITPTFSELAELYQKHETESDHPIWINKITNAVNHIAGLTAVDGATIINDRFELLAFGVKIGRSTFSSRVDKIMVTEPIVGNVASIVPPVQNGGTRHLSAAQFVFDQRDSLALVASQDGRFTIFSWSPCDNIVQSHRVDALLF